MQKAICPKCRTLIEVDKTLENATCKYCHEEVPTALCLKIYYQSIATYTHKGDVAYNQKTNYQEAFHHYKMLNTLTPNDLNSLIKLVNSKLRSSTLDHLTIIEATDLLLKGSDNVEIDYENVLSLSNALKAFREGAKLIVDYYQKYASEDKYQIATNEYKYFLTAYLNIYQTLDNMNKYFKDSEELIKEEINSVDKLKLNKVLHLSTDTNLIFPSKIKQYHLHVTLNILTIIGAVISFVGLILLTTLKEMVVVKASILSIGLFLFIGGYFLNHYLTITRPKKIKNNS